MLSRSWIILIGLILFVLFQRMFELRIAAQNQRWALAHGAQEFGAKHYPLFFLLHGGWSIAWIAESIASGLHLQAYWKLWLGVFVLAQCLRYFAITTLGKYWNTRILIIPEHKRIQTGIYRLIPHPNYLAVVLELLSLPMIFGAYWTAGIASLLNGVLLLGIRIPVENKALSQLKP